MLDSLVQLTEDFSRPPGGAASAIVQGGLTFIIGAPRSGTTWLGKIFDSNPRVLYRHEPDLGVTETKIPITCNDSTCFGREQIEFYVQRLIEARTLKSAGSLPIFAKDFDRPFGRLLRIALVGAMMAARTSMRLSSSKVAMPWEFVDLGGAIRPHFVIKSISALGRAGLLAEALPDARIILLLRNPFAQIASRLVGIAQRRFETVGFQETLLATRQAAELGVTANMIEHSSLVEKLTWEWVILNRKAIDDVRHHPNVKIVIYRDLVNEPVPIARDLLAFCGLGWHPATAAFIRRSTNFRGPDMYFHVYKDAKRSLDKWRSVLELADRARISAIVRRSELGAFWPDLFG
jgi:hypothetical protein